MKRSEINASIQLALDMFEAHRFRLPRWAGWTPENWAHCGPEALDIRRRALGWQVTDFGAGAFEIQGIAQFTLRNCPPPAGAPAGGYSEKIQILLKRQILPAHRHPDRVHDLVNRGGGDLLVQVFRAGEDADPAQRIPTTINGIAYLLKSASITRLAPGDSLVLPAGVFHKCWAEKNGTLAGEVSTALDEPADTRFLEEGDWTPPIEEDEPPQYLLAREYPAFD